MLLMHDQAEWALEKTKPSGGWPDNGSVEFKNYSTRYQEDRDPVLRDISTNIKGGEKVITLSSNAATQNSVCIVLIMIKLLREFTRFIIIIVVIIFSVA